MIFRPAILSIATASALPVVLESNRDPIPNEGTLKPLVESAADADEAADRILQHYQAEGFPAVGVEVHDSIGTRHVEIDVSRFQQLLIGPGPARTRKVGEKLFSPLAGGFVDQNELQRVLKNFHANPFHRAVPRLQPSADGLHINALLRIDQSDAQQFSAGYHDTGANPLPRERFWLQGEFSDLWNQNSLSTIRLTSAPDPGEFLAAQLGSRFFLNNGQEASLSLSYSGASGTALSRFDAYSWQIGAQWRGASQSIGPWKTRALIGLSYRKSNNALEFGDFRNRGVADVFQITLGQSVERNWDHGQTRLSGSFVLSPFGNDEEHSSLRPGAEGDYALARLALWHRQDLPNNWDLVVTLASQWASDPVLQADQIALGGASGVRGLSEQFGLGDEGHFGGLELRTPVIEISPNWRFRPSVFCQTGRTVDLARNNHTSAVTAGFGLQLAYRQKLRASVHSAWRLDEGGAELHTQLSWNF